MALVPSGYTRCCASADSGAEGILVRCCTVPGKAFYNRLPGRFTSFVHKSILHKKNSTCN